MLGEPEAVDQIVRNWSVVTNRRRSVEQERDACGFGCRCAALLIVAAAQGDRGGHGDGEHGAEGDGRP